MAKKLSNSFKTFLPLTYFEFRQKSQNLTANEAVVAQLLKICCEKGDVKAIKMAFERILGKPEKVIVIKRTLVKMVFPDARTKALEPTFDDRVVDEVRVINAEDKVVLDKKDTPGGLLRHMIDEIGLKKQGYAFEVLERKDKYTVAEVMAANLYGIAMAGSDIGAIDLLFQYLDGAVADVIRIEGEDTILLENWADVAPYEAKQDDKGVWYVEKEAVR